MKKILDFLLILCIINRFKSKKEKNEHKNFKSINP